MRKWKSLEKLTEECGELVVELMKLRIFPDGKHPGRKRNVILSTEDECADVLAAVNYFIDKHKLNRSRIEKRANSKYKKFERWWGVTFRTAKKKAKKSVKNKASKKSSKAQIPGHDVQRIENTSKTS